MLPNGKKKKQRKKKDLAQKLTKAKGGKRAWGKGGDLEEKFER